jgi:hypothetical protein
MWSGRIAGDSGEIKGVVLWRLDRLSQAEPSAFKIFQASGSLISLCRGIASIRPVCGLVHSECDPPSRFK